MSFIAASGDICRIGSWVVANSPTVSIHPISCRASSLAVQESGRTIFGRISEIIMSAENKTVQIVLDVFQLA